MIDALEAARVISQFTQEAIVVPAMMANRAWHAVSAKPNALHLGNIGSMGKASSVGLGLALARPDKKVIILDGDGSLLMNLGSLVTIANMAPPNLVHFVFENGVYQTTGGQPIPAAGRFSFAVLARDAGYPHTHEFEDLDRLEKNLKAIMDQAGPTFICLKISPASGSLSLPRVTAENTAAQLRAALER